MGNYKRSKDFRVNLMRYLREDTIYQDYLKGRLKGISDFDQYCIDHCEDIAMLLEENQRLKQELLSKRGQNENNKK